MSDRMTVELTLLFGGVVLGMMAGRLCAWGASRLPAILEHQCQEDARELLGLESAKRQELRLTAPSRSEVWRVQIGCAVLTLVGTMHFGPTAQGLFALLLTWCLLVLSLIDKEHHILPDALVLPGIWAGLVVNAFGVFTSLETAFWGAVAGYMGLWSMHQLVRLITGRDSMGRGDFKLLAMIGAWGGLHVLGWTLVLSLLAAALTALYLKLQGKVTITTKLPFGPFLSAAGWGSILFLTP